MQCVANTYNTYVVISLEVENVMFRLQNRNREMTIHKNIANFILGAYLTQARISHCIYRIPTFSSKYQIPGFCQDFGAKFQVYKIPDFYIIIVPINVDVLTGSKQKVN